MAKSKEIERCPVCHQRITDDEPIEICSLCEEIVHLDCMGKILPDFHHCKNCLKENE